jgi:hypothetical protein
MQTRQVASGVVGVLFGGFILLNSLLQGGPQGTGAYRTGQWIGLLIGLLMFVAGFYYLWQAFAESKPRRPKKKNTPATAPGLSKKRQPPAPGDLTGLPPRRRSH